MGEDESFTTSFAPFVLLGPALGRGCVLPDIDVRRPADLDFDRFAAACAVDDVQLAWLSPASARRIVATASGRRLPLRQVLLAGAPIDAGLAAAMAEVTDADVRSPYGMTEVLPVTDGSGAALDDPLPGTITGRPLAGVEVLVVPLDEPSAPPLPVGEWGELLVAAPWMRDGYDRRWATDDAATIQRDGRRFHRTGDVGWIDGDDRMRQLGRAQHVVRLPSGPVSSVALEQSVVEAAGAPVAAVGVGPVGTQVVAIILDAPGPMRLAPAATADAVRDACPLPVAAVLCAPLPVDIRHQSKVDRRALAAAAEHHLAGR